MSKHTDTGRAGTRRGGKKLWILIPVIAVLIIAAALVWLNSVYVYAGGLHRRDSAQIDLRGKSISEERYLRLREQLPDCKIYWDVPIGGAVIDCEADTYTDRCSQALELMTQAGLRRPEALISLGTVTLLYRNTPAQTALAQRLQKVWQEKLGLSVTLQGEDAETYQQLLSSGAFTLALTELDALYNDASAYLDLWRSGDTRNYALIYMNAYNILMRVAAASTSAEARDAYLKDAEWLLLDTANVIPLYEKEQAYALRGDVTGVVSDGMGAWYFGALWRVEQ